MLDGAATGGENRPCHGPGFEQQGPLRLPETVPAGAGDNLGNGSTQPFAEHGIGIDKGVAEAGGEQPADRSLAGGTKSGKDDDFGQLVHDSAQHIG